MIIKWLFIAPLLMVLLMAARTAADAEATPSSGKPPVIDIHCHAAGLGYGNSGCFVSEKLRNSWKLKTYLDSFGVSPADLETNGDAVVIDRIARAVALSSRVDGAVILAMDGVVGPDGRLDREHTEVYIPNAFVAAQTARYPHLYFGASINPNRSDAVEQLRAVADQGAVLIKWLPSIMAIDPADPAIVPFYREMARLGLPLLTHTGSEYSFSRPGTERFSDPQRLTLALDTGVTVIAAHLGGGGRTDGESNVDRLKAMMPRYANLYTDISSLTQVNRVGWLVSAAGNTAYTGRLVYGTDFPLIETPLCWPVFHVPAISTGRAVSISRISNPWDRDVALREALGMTEDILIRPAALLRIQRIGEKQSGAR